MNRVDAARAIVAYCEENVDRLLKRCPDGAAISFVPYYTKNTVGVEARVTGLRCGKDLVIRTGTALEFLGRQPESAVQAPCEFIFADLADTNWDTAEVLVVPGVSDYRFRENRAKNEAEFSA